MVSKAQSVDEWEDAEIRRKLEEFGSPVGPITRSTRKVLVSKLKNLIRKQNSARLCSNCINYSSGDESLNEDHQMLPLTPTRKLKRPMTGLFNSPESLESNYIKPNITVSKINSRSKSNIHRPSTTVVKTESDTDSDVDVISCDGSQTSRRTSLNHPRRPLDENEISLFGVESSNTTEDCYSVVLKQKSALLLQNNDTRGEPLAQNTTSFDTPGNHSRLISKNNNFESKNRLRYVRETFYAKSKYFNLPRSLKMFFTFFVIVIAYILCSENYEGIWSLAAFDSDENIYPICGQENVDPSMCIEDRHLMPALEVAQVIIPHVLNLTISTYCHDFSTQRALHMPSITDEEALMLLKKQIPNKKPPYLERDLKNFKILLIHNSHWEIQVISNGMKEMNTILFYGQFAARQKSLPWSCHIRRITSHIPNISIFMALLFSGGYLIFTLTRYAIKRRDLHRRKVFQIITEIIQVVSSHLNENNQYSYIPIDRCRDMLIHPTKFWDRKREWEEAVKFIEDCESRVRTELRFINGHYVKVWVWTAATNAPNGES